MSCSSRSLLAALAVPAFVFGVFSTTSLASEGHDHAGEALPPVRLTSLEEAVNAVAYFQREVDAHVASGRLAKVHGSAFAARDAATSVTQFADQASGPARQELASTIQRIGAVAVQLDKYGDAGKAQETATFAGKLREDVESLQRVTGITVRHDWKPTFLEAASAGGHGHAASKCPHKANHGGRFSLALNDAYHVEGSYPAAGEFRMHFYDKESCPIPAQAFSGRLLFQDARQQVELVQAPDGTHLVGRLPSAVSPPLSVTAIVRLPHPETGNMATEHFSYNFYRLSKPAAAATSGTLGSLPAATATSVPSTGH